MATLAPTISRALDHPHSVQAILQDSICSIQAESDPVPAQPDPSKTLAGYDQYCGYCSLFAHTPVVPGTAYAPPLLQQSAPLGPVAKLESARYVAPLLLARPRGPPTAS